MKRPIKTVIVMAPILVEKGDTQTAIIDCQGFEWLIFAVGATSEAIPYDYNSLPMLKLSESDTEAAADFSDMPEMIDEKGGGSVRPEAENIWGPRHNTFGLYLKDHKRYVKLTVSMCATQTIWAMATLFLPEVLRLTDAHLEFLNSLDRKDEHTR